MLFKKCQYMCFINEIRNKTENGDTNLFMGSDKVRFKNEVKRREITLFLGGDWVQLSSIITVFYKINKSLKFEQQLWVLLLWWFSKKNYCVVHN